MTVWTKQAADRFGIHLSPKQVAAFDLYARELVDWNARMNLTAITEPELIRARHFLDSLSIVEACPFTDGMRVLDVGTGAGFPGLPLAIAFPNLRVTLLEATGKKVKFLDHVIQTLGLLNVTTLRARVEEIGQAPKHRARYDVVVARAVAHLPTLAEYLLPLVRIGGYAVAMKGGAVLDEIASAGHAIQVLGGQVQRIQTVELPVAERSFYLVVLEKVAETPAIYPRNPGTPTKNPL